jgi:hypothetical protein
MQAPLTAFVMATQRAGWQLSSAMAGLLALLKQLGGRIVVAGPRIDVRPGEVPVMEGVRWAGSGGGSPAPGSSVGDDTLAAYAAGLLSLDRDLSWGRIVLLDDSFVALDPRQLVASLDAAPELDVASLTMMVRPQPCLHTNWIAFQGPRTLRHSSFFDWWRQAAGSSEQALTDHFVAAGLRVGSVFRADRAQCILAVCRALAWGVLPLEVPAAGSYSADPDVALGLDPRIFLWDELMVQYGIVFLELLRCRAHRVNVELLGAWLAANPAAAALIEEALRSQS